jgi:hypothetical protein
MDFIIGGLVVICLLLLYDKFKVKKAPELPQATKEELERQKENEEHFAKMWDYNPKKALGGNKR